MNIRTGCQLIKLNNIDYEVPKNISLFKSPKGDVVYLTGITRKIMSEFKSEYFGIVKFIKTNEFREIELNEVFKFMTNSFQIRNINNKDYLIPLGWLNDADSLIKDFNKYNLKPLKEFEKTFDKYIEIYE